VGERGGTGSEKVCEQWFELGSSEAQRHVALPMKLSVPT